MFFLLRMGFWLTIVALLLPAVSGITSPDGKSADGQSQAAQVDPVDAFTAATSAVADAGGFCERQPHACAVGAQLIGAVGEKAEAAARMAFAYVLEQISEEKRRAAERNAGPPAGDTLTTHDLSPEWQGPTLPGAAPALAEPPLATPANAVPLPPKKPA
jgi:hypothetical protein